MLKRTSGGSVILPSGERITPSEQAAFRNLVRRSNAQRERELKQLPTFEKYTYKNFNKESNFITRKRSARLGTFQSREQFNKYKAKIRRQLTDAYKTDIAKTYKVNLQQSIAKTFNNKTLNEFVKKLTPDEIKKLSLSKEFNDIGYVYNEPQAASTKLNKMLAQVKKIISKDEYQARFSKFAQDNAEILKSIR